MTAEQDGNAEVALSPADWVARQAELYESSGGTKGTTQLGVPCLLMDYVGRLQRDGAAHGADVRAGR